MLNEILAREEKEEKERREREERERMKMMPSSVERIVDDSGIVARSTVLRKNKAQPPSPGPQGQPLEMTEVATSPKKGAMGTGTTTAATTPAPVTPSSASSASARSPASAPSSLSKEPKRITLSAPPPVPSEPPKTVYEFERVWRGLKNHPSLFAEYLCLFKRSTFKRVIKETISPDLISSVLSAVKDQLLVANGNSAAAVVVLEGLTKVPKFEILLSILPEEDLSCLRDCMQLLEDLEAHANAPVAVGAVGRLRKAYHL
jgi:hypothetical protein